MSKDELLYLVDKEDNVIGSVWKSEAHKNPQLIHREVGLVVLNKDFSKVLLQQRSFKKETNPGKYTLAVAGHAGYQEDMELAVIRECKEEIGIDIKPMFLFKECSLSSNKKENRFMWTYYTLVDEDIKITLDKAEVEKVEWVNIENLEKYLKKGSHSYKYIKKALDILNKKKAS